MKNPNNFYVTTPIYYVTAKPHLGSLYSTVLADIIARAQRLHGDNVFFLTGTDEHGQKIALAAKQAGKDPKTFVDEFIPVYKQVWSQYEIDYQRFIRTTDTDHVRGAQLLIQQLIDQGDIYKDTYRGWYCTPCETFVTDKDAHHKKADHIPLCASCARATEWVEESSYFFKLSAYQDKLLALYATNPDFIAPKERANEVISFVKDGLKDLSMSRSTVKWGVPFPKDPEHTIYVWAEALTNYITAIGYAQQDQQEYFNSWWPANVQVLGKDIVRFHAVCWPALLMAAGLPLPQRLLVHGWIQIDKQKMSKSLGNVIDPVPLGNQYGVDAIRYFFARYLPINQDAEFSIASLERAIESDLANDLGNLLNRLTMLAVKYDCAQLEPVAVWTMQSSLNLRSEFEAMLNDFKNYWTDCQFHLALGRLWKCINQVNAYFHAAQPWKVAKTNTDQFKEIMSATAHGLHVIALLLWPVMPKKMEALLASLGKTVVANSSLWNQSDAHAWQESFNITVVPPLFEKPITQQDNSMTESINKENLSIAPEQNDEQSYITIDDVMKVELVVGTIEMCEEVAGSDKLLKLTVNLGPKGTRHIFSGIKKWFAPQDLIGKQGVFVANLKPRKMLNMMSEGMMLCAQDEYKKPYPVMPHALVPNGTRLT